MDLETFRQYCLSKLTATESTPFGEDVLVFKVAGRYSRSRHSMKFQREPI